MTDQVFLFYGDEDFLIQQRIEELKKTISDPSLNFEQIEAEEPDLERIVSALQTQSLLLGDKLLVIRDVDLKSDAWDGVLPALKKLPPGIRVVFWASAVSKKSKLYKLIEGMGEACEFKTYADWEQDRVVFWITQRTKQLGKEIEPSAAASLQEICGNSLRKLASEINKLITYVGERKRIEGQDVLALASPGEINIFALANALMEKDLGRALSVFRILYKNKADLFHLSAMLATQYRTMLQIKHLPQAAPQKIAQTLGANPYFVRRCMEKAGRFREEELRRDLELLLEADLSLKSGASPVPTFELLLSSLCGVKDGKQI